MAAIARSLCHDAKRDADSDNGAIRIIAQSGSWPDRGRRAPAVRADVDSKDEQAQGGQALLSIDDVERAVVAFLQQQIAHAPEGVNIQEFSTECLSASWSGETLVKAVAELSVPRSVPTAELRRLLEALANELMVDVTLDDLPNG